MKLAPTVHSGAARAPLVYPGRKLLASSRFLCPRNVPIRFVPRRLHSPAADGCACGQKHHPPYIVWSGKTERELETSTSPKVSSGSRSSNGIDDNENESSSDNEPNSGNVTLKSADYASALRSIGLCVFSAVAFGVGLGFKDGAGKASEFFAGYLLEQSLSVDNLFVFVLIFKYFKVPLNYQSRVLSYGIAGAIIFRLTLILLGTATIQRFEAVNILLAMILLYSSFKLFAEEDEDTDLSENFIVKTCQKFIPVTCNLLLPLLSQALKKAYSHTQQM